MRNRLACGSLLAAMALWAIRPDALANLFSSAAARDVEQGAQVAKLVERQIGLYSMPEAEACVREIGERLVAAANDSRWDFSFHIVDQSEPNAFSIPGGGVYVSRGLLALVNREDELAGVLAHEIAHVTQRHSAREQRKALLPGFLTVPGHIVGNVVSDRLGALINTPVETAGGAWLSHYSRGQETEADKIGTDTAAKAGYDPAALGDILVRLDRAVTSQTGQEHSFSIFDSHPMTENRLRDIRRQSSKLTTAARPPVASDPTSLWTRLDGMWCGQNPEAGVFHQNQFLHASAGFTITFPSGWKHRNTPQFVMAADPGLEALLLLATAAGELDPQAAGEQFVQQMQSSTGLAPDSARRTSFGEFPGYVVSYRKVSGRAPVYLHFAWVAMAGATYQLIGLAPEKYEETLRNAVLTLRPLTEAESGTVSGKRLGIATARSGERLEDLGTRCGNVWSPAYTALVNGLTADQALANGQRIKIARTETVK
jgi:predicted Zn-dependent protease